MDRANEQVLYKVEDQLKVNMNVYLTRERNAPSIQECRFAVLPLKEQRSESYVVYDRLLNRIVNGVFFGDLEGVLEVAQLYNEGLGNPDMSPNGLALGLIYPGELSNEESTS